MRHMKNKKFNKRMNKPPKIRAVQAKKNSVMKPMTTTTPKKVLHPGVRL